MLEKFRSGVNPSDFDEIADILMRHAYIVVDNKNVTYRIREIEFYLYCDTHKDLYAHGSPEQHLFEGVYLHRFGNGTFRGGTFKGMDLTLGNSNQRLGILVRGLISSDDQHIDGPCLAVNRILTHYGVADVESYVKRCVADAGCNREEAVQRFVSTGFLENGREIQLIKGERIGLSNKYPAYRHLPYRYGIKGLRYKKKFPVQEPAPTQVKLLVLTPNPTNNVHSTDESIDL